MSLPSQFLKLRPQDWDQLRREVEGMRPGEVKVVWLQYLGLNVDVGREPWRVTA